MSDRPVDTERRRLVEKLLLEHGAALYRRMRRLCRSEAETQDIVSQTTVRVLEHAADFDPDGHFLAWVTKIGTRLFLDLVRKEEKEGHPEDIDKIDAAAPPPYEPSLLDWFSPADALQALELVPEPFRETYRRFARLKQPYRKIAREMGTTVSTVGTRINRARDKLREILLSIKPPPKPRN